MTNALQKSALDKLKECWTEYTSINDLMDQLHETDERSNKASSLHRISIDVSNPVEMTRAEANALRSWFKEQGLSEKHQLSFEGDLAPGQFSISESEATLAIKIDLDDPKGFDPAKHIEFYPKQTGDIQKHHIDLHREDFGRLQREFWRDGWFSWKDDQPKGPAQQGMLPQL